ncbi:MAG: hypothetical protein HKN87_09910 [Saprospiraceae bacterium]|nr:hypothetical protein [Saprospiraceae bacterium]
MGRLLLFLGISCWIGACTTISEEALLGTWKPIWVTEGSDTVQADLSKVALKISDQQQFHYQITSSEMMSGSFQLSSNLLKLYSDMPQPDTTIVQILDLQEDQLLLRMNYEGKERKMKLLK